MITPKPKSYDQARLSILEDHPAENEFVHSARLQEFFKLCGIAQSLLLSFDASSRRQLSP